MPRQDSWAPLALDRNIAVQSCFLELVANILDV